jgi:CheY-like chemotaxis protein
VTAKKRRAARSLSVLVVEDDVDVARTLGALLDLLGHRVRVVHFGGDAIAAAQEERPDVLLCDIGLPGAIDGYEVARRFRANPSLSSVHLIAVTGWGHADDRRKALEAGFNLHLTKPVGPDRLEAALSAVPTLPPRP